MGAGVNAIASARGIEQRRPTVKQQRKIKINYERGHLFLNYKQSPKPSKAGVSKK